MHAPVLCSFNRKPGTLQGDLVIWFARIWCMLVQFGAFGCLFKYWAGQLSDMCRVQHGVILVENDQFQALFKSLSSSQIESPHRQQNEAYETIRMYVNCDDGCICQSVGAGSTLPMVMSFG